MFSSKYLKTRVVCSIFVLYSFVSGQQPAPPIPEQPPSGDLVLTLRLLPKVKPETIELLNQVTVPRSVRLAENESAIRVLGGIYGAFFPRIETMLKALNPFLKPQDINTFVAASAMEIKLPAGAEYYYDVIKPSAAKSDLKEQARLETGSDAQDIVSQIRQKTGKFKNFFKKYCEEHSCTRTQRVKFASQNAIAFPYVSRYVSFAIKPEAKEQVSEILSALEKDEGVLDAEVHVPSRLISHVSGMDAAPPCDVEPTAPEWFITSIGFDRLPLEVLRGQNEVIIAIMDSGIDRNDKRFSLWQNLPEAIGVPKRDDDRNGYFDDTFGCDFISQSDFPVDDQRSSEYRSHGTHVAGLASGRFLSEPLAQAVSQRVRAMILKIAKHDGDVDNGAVNDAIVYSQNKNASVVNMSFEGDFSASINKHIKEDPARLYVAAAGNGDQFKRGLDLERDNIRRFPAKLSRELDNVISVAAHNVDNQLACFSNFGRTTVDLAAPGVQVESTVTGNELMKISGTSQAAPLVSLAAALLYSQGLREPWLVKQRILASVDFVPAYRGKLTSEGKLNVAKALSVYDDVIELKDPKELLRGKLISPPPELKVGDRIVPFRAIKKIVNFVDESGARVQRVTWLNNNKLEHVYGTFTLPQLVLKVGDTCLTLEPDQIRDVIPRLSITDRVETCPNN